MTLKKQPRRIPFEEEGVRVIMDGSSSAIELHITRRMTVEEARAHLACVREAIECYCNKLELIA